MEGELGRGGMAVVYRVRHVQLGTAHALKVLYLPSAAIRDRLVQEGRIQAQLRHPNIVNVTDVVDVRGSPGLLMELVDGVPLDGLLAQRRLSASQIDGLARGILAAVAEAHTRGLVHRDLKPQNVLIARSSSGAVAKVTDFGLARILAEGDEGERRTASGSTMGTPGYMAPEQFGATRDVDARADVFALGAVLYELAAGRRAFEGSDVFELISAARQGQFPALGPLAPELSQDRVALIERCLSPAPGERPADARAVLEAWAGPSAAVDATNDLLAGLPAPRAPELLTGAAGSSATGAHTGPAPTRPPSASTLDVELEASPTRRTSASTLDVGLAAPSLTPSPAPAALAPSRSRLRYLGAAAVVAVALIAVAVALGAAREWGPASRDPAALPPSARPEAPPDPAAISRSQAALRDLLPGVDSPWLAEAVAGRLPNALARREVAVAHAAELAEIHRQVVGAGLTRAVVGVPLAESGMDPLSVSSVCGAGLWQFMPETAVNNGLRVASCLIEGRSELWTPAPGAQASLKSPYYDGEACRLSMCSVDERLDVARSTSAAIRLMSETAGLAEVSVHPQHAALPLLAFAGGNAAVLPLLGDAKGGDALVALAGCDAAPDCSKRLRQLANALPDYVAHAVVALCATGLAGEPGWCDGIPVSAERALSLVGWLDQRPTDLFLALAPLDASGADSTLARALDLDLDSRLRGSSRVRILTVPEGQEPSRGSGDLGVDHVITGRLGQIGPHVRLELVRWDGTQEALRLTREADAPERLLPQIDGMLLDLLSTEVRPPVPDVVEAFGHARAPQLKRCYEDAVTDAPGLAATVTVRFRVLPSGRVGDVTATVTEGDEAAASPLAACARDVVGGWVFPLGVQGEAEYPFVFSRRR